ncbi:MAG: hypothetical protein M3Y42_13880 [Actinomycetota bacterium]|nr:hypothetical protein [Actinomycetota bacterium]MDQ2958042.1 hypothetical protein [Actinomycetota bacterium]
MAARRCAQALNALHSILYFSPDFAAELLPYRVTDHSSVYLAARAAPLGPVDGAVVTAVFNTFSPDLITARLPGLWQSVAAKQAVQLRQRAVAVALERLLGHDALRSAELIDAARLATRAARAGSTPARPLYAANAAQAEPDEPPVALWHAATMLREHRGDGHTAVLAYHGLAGIDALVLDCASAHGMSKQIVMPQRGWTEPQWAAGVERLTDRGLLDGAARLTGAGRLLRDEIEQETGRLDRQPYLALNGDEVLRLAGTVRRLVRAAAAAEVFPSPLDVFFVPDDGTWNRLL